ncbi:MAG: cytochrome C biogenesis protein CcdA [Methanospirillaceae archaeon]|nr:cytochrome C biogenesis protein CcdA [Methanospirillaceae archaeon]
MVSFDPSTLGIFIFGILAGICPCNSVLCLGLVGYLTSSNTCLSPAAIIRLTLSFCAGTILVLLPLGFIAGYAGQYLLFFNDTIAWSLGGIVLILMGLQLLHLYKPPTRRIFRCLKAPVSYTVIGTFLIGLSFGAITVGRGAPMLFIILTYIALHQTALQGFFTILIYATGLSLPLLIIASIGGVIGKKIRDYSRMSGDTFDRIIGYGIILVGLYFLVIAFY